MGALAGSMRARVAPERRWPPTADREGVDLSTGAVLGILAGVFLAELLAYVATAGSALPAVSPFGSPNETATRLLVVPAAISAAISLGLVLLLGWRRAAGLALGSMSPWGVVPLIILLVAAGMTANLAGVASAPDSFLGLVLVGLFLAALAEEILFRGYLHHGLTRRVGGRDAVLVGSVLFAAAHLPSLVQQRLEGTAVAVSLVVLFGFGVLLCRIRAATGSVWFATGVHTLWNFVTVGVVGWAYSPEDLPPGFVALKLVPVVIGLVMAVRLRRFGPGGGPPMPLAVDPPVVSRFPRPLPPPPRPDLT